MPDRDIETVSMSRIEIEALLLQAAHAGAKLALTEIGLGDTEAGPDIRDLRDWLRACRIIKSEALKTAVSVATKALIMSVAIGVAYMIGVKVGG